MDYEEFKEKLLSMFMDYLPVEYRDMKLTLTPVQKVNVTMDSIHLAHENNSNHMSPNLYVNDMYKAYIKEKDIDVVFKEYAKIMTEAIKHEEDVSSKIELSKAKENVVFQLINTKENEEILKKSPHRIFLDLSIIYRWVVSVHEDSIQSAIISNKLSENLQMSEEDLYNAALSNTKKILPIVVKSMNDTVYEMLISQGMTPEMARSAIKDVSPNDEMWVLTNKRGVNGASALIYEYELYDLAKRLNSDLYILPSSIHEVLALCSKDKTPEELSKMVYEVNMTQVSIDERLSNEIYYYSRKSRKLTLVTSSDNDLV